MSIPTIRAVVGLGNPGAGHARTRHNAGFWFADALAAQRKAAFRVESRFHGELARIGADGILLLKPGTYMNRSGQAAQAVMAFHKLAPEQILVVHDDLDLPPGTVRLKNGGGHGGHNGLRDLHANIGETYLRLRLGIGHPGHKDQVLEYVLQRPSAADEKAIHGAIDAAVAAFDVLLTHGWDKAVQQLHSISSPLPAPRGEG